MNFYKEIIEVINRLNLAIEKQEQGKFEYISLEKSCRDFLNQIYENMADGIQIGYSEVVDKHLDNKKLEVLTIRNIVKGCYKEGASKEFLQKNFMLSDSEVDKIVTNI